MKYAQFMIGLLAGTALGGAVVASTGGPLPGTAVDKDAIKQIVRDTISEEPKLLIDTLQKYTVAQRKVQDEGSNDVLKDKAVQDMVFNYPEAASVGPKDSTRVIVEFFDYNCPACKFMFKGVEELVQKDKTAKVIFREYPIFGPVSETNAKLGVAVNRLYPDKYFAFHEKMMTHEGRTDEKTALAYIKELGMDADKVKAESAKKEVSDVLDANRAVGEKLRIQGTPTLVIGDQFIPHAIDFNELESRVNGKPPAAAPSAE